MAKLTCKNKDEDGSICANTFFEIVKVNEFHDRASNLSTRLREIDIDSDIKMYRCIRCGKLTLPSIDYYNTLEEDRKLYVQLQSLLDGEKIVRKVPKPIQRPGAGQVSFVKGSVKDNPENHGKFIRG